MGFGYMFLGCFFLVGTLGIPDIIGFLLFYVGMNIASKHCICFNNAKKVCILGFAFSAFDFALQIADWLNIDLFSASVSNTFSTVYTLYMVCFYLVLFLGIADIAKDVDLPKIRSMAYSNMALVPLFLIAAQAIVIYVSENSASIPEYGAQIYGTGMLLSLLATILTAILLFRCYARICLEGDEDMERREHDFKSPLDFYEKNKKKNQTTVSRSNNNNKKKKK